MLVIPDVDTTVIHLSEISDNAHITIVSKYKGKYWVYSPVYIKGRGWFKINLFNKKLFFVHSNGSDEVKSNVTGSKSLHDLLRPSVLSTNTEVVVHESMQDMFVYLLKLAKQYAPAE